MKKEKRKNIKEYKEKMAAFICYLDKGIEYVKEKFPDQLNFVLANKDKDYTAIHEVLDKEFETIIHS